MRFSPPSFNEANIHHHKTSDVINPGYPAGVVVVPGANFRYLVRSQARILIAHQAGNLDTIPTRVPRYSVVDQLGWQGAKKGGFCG
eukprot:1096772-Rhodomonas_salina.2